MSARPDDEKISSDKIALANTRPVLTFGMPFEWMIITVFVPPILLIIAFVFTKVLVFGLLMLSVPMGFLGSWAVKKDHNRPRILRLWLTSGTAFADRSSAYGDSPPAFPPRDKWFGSYDG